MIPTNTTTSLRGRENSGKTSARRRRSPPAKWFPVVASLLCACGDQTEPPSPQSSAPIVDGDAADGRDFPGIAAILQKRQSGSLPGPNGFKAFCGATVIHRQWVVTAAHCIVDVFPMGEVIRALTGLHVATGRDRISEYAESDLKPVTTAFIHPEFWTESEGHDIGLLYVEGGVEGAVMPLLTDPSLTSPNSPLSVAGWGADRNGDSSDSLRRADQIVLDLKECANVWPKEWIHDTQICTYGAGKNSAINNGDSGGPLVVNPGPGAQLAGIVSLGGCDKDIGERCVSVFTSVPVFSGWVSQCMGDPAACPNGLGKRWPD